MSIQIKISRSERRRISWADFERALPDSEGAAAIAFFRSKFGENWPAEDAPFAHSFITAFQQGPAEGVRLYRMIGTLNGIANLDLLVGDLGRRAWAQHVSSVMALEFCSRLRAADFGVELIKPDSREKRPDARVMLSGRWIAVEFKALHERDDYESWVELQDRLLSELALSNVELGSLDIAFAPAALDNRAAVVDGLRAVYASQCREYRELPAQTGFARFNGKNVGMRDFPIDQQADDAARITANLGAWSRQLAASAGPALLVVKAKNIFSAALLTGAVQSRADQLSGELSPHLLDVPEIGALLVYEEPFLAVPPSYSTATVRAHVTAGASNGGHARVAILIPNPAARVPLVADELLPLIGKGMRW